MIYRATNKRKSELCRFMTSVQQFSVADCDGNMLRKRDVFEQLFDEDTDDQVQLNLLINNAHGYYQLLPREGYDEAVQRKAFIEEKIREVMAIRSLALARRMNLTENVDLVIKWMTEAMIDAYENHVSVNEAVNKTVG